MLAMLVGKSGEGCSLDIDYTAYMLVHRFVKGFFKPHCMFVKARKKCPFSVSDGQVVMHSKWQNMYLSLLARILLQSSIV